MRRCRNLLALALTACSLPVPSPPSQPAPNILWITVEDLSPRLAPYGDSLAATPNLNRLASEGMTFTRVFSVSGVCAPSRSALITGTYPISIGTHHMRTSNQGPGLPGPYLAVPPPDVKTFTESLRAAGYYCTNNAKIDYQFGTPLTAWDESSRTAHWRGRAPGQPFFAVFNSDRTHESRVWPNPEEEPILDPARVEVPPYDPDTPVVRTDLARHYDNITRVDGWVGEILEQLAEDDLSGNTIVFFFSDHGDGLPRAKRWVYDSGLHVPMFVRWPGEIAPGSVTDRLVSFVDFAPTVLSLAGVETPEHIQGRAFLGAAADHPREYVYAARDRMDEAYDMIRAIRGVRFKYIRNFQPEKPFVQRIRYRNRMPLMQELLRLNQEGGLEGPQQLWFRPRKPVEELYDLQSDPHEIRNLAEDPGHQQTLDRLRRALEAWRAEVGDMGRIPEDEMIEQMWPGGKQPITAAPAIHPSGGELGRSVKVALSCPTEGASIAYTIEEGEAPHWRLYTGPIELTTSTRLCARAIRYGYKESPEAKFRLHN